MTVVHTSRHTILTRFVDTIKALVDKVLYDAVFHGYVALGKFMRVNGHANLVASLITCTSWLIWMCAFDNEWNNTVMFAAYHSQLECNRATDSLEEAQCQAAYLLWASPLIISVLCGFFGIACLYLSKDGSAVRMLVVQFLVLGMGMWVSVSISGAEMGLADDILQFALLFCSMMIVVCVNIIGYDNLRVQLGSLKMTQKISEYSQSNFAKGMIVVLTLPVIPGFLVLSALIRQARVFGLSMASAKRTVDAEFAYFTSAGWAMLLWLFADVTAVFTWAGACWGFPKSRHTVYCPSVTIYCLLHTSHVDCLPIQATCTLATDTFRSQSQRTSPCSTSSATWAWVRVRFCSWGG